MDSEHADIYDESGRRLLTLRSLSRLTQVELARRVGVSKYSILKWEGSESSPNETHLRQLIAVFVAQGAFAAGQEREEAEALWEHIRQQPSSRLPPFDAAWFAGVGSQEPGARSQEPGARSQEPGARSQEPGDGGRSSRSPSHLVI